MKEYQRQGVGKGFWKIACQHVKEAGYDEFMTAVNSHNIGAIQFYTAMGGEIVLAEDTQLRMVFSIS